MIAAMACYALNDTLVKLTLQAFPAGQVLAVRGMAASALVLFVAHADGVRLDAGLREPSVLLRCALEISTAITSVLALARASLTTVSALMMLAPLLVAMASMLARWEPARPARLLAVLAGLGGAWLVMRPHAQASASGLALAGLCAMSLAARDLVTRRLPPSVSTATVAIAATAAVCGAGPLLGLALQETWQPLMRRETLLLLGAAACAAAGNYALIAACRRTDLALVAPFRYSILVWACLLAYAVWGDVPDPITLLGIAVIAAAGIASLRGARPP